MTRKVPRANAADVNRKFEIVARAWHDLNAPRWKSRQHAGDVIGSLEKGVFPHLGNIDVREITPAMVLDVLRKIERRV
ncbi:phage integrase central domain-containing protein [Acidocella sp.]|uniref:phage integrase central domain-containing protein n=1 Tax=Acidocella sp. TaxID=50710 RepID=UPI003CFCA724